jgi:steroid delta-isomerase-like uncharacterized protein
MTEQNKNIVRRVIDEVWNRGEYSVLGELIARDYVGHSSSIESETHGPQGYQQYFADQREAFADIHYTVDVQVAEGDLVATRWTARATHTGEFQGIPAKGHKGTIEGISIFRIANSCIVECWTNYDALGLFQQLGLMPANG